MRPRSQSTSSNRRDTNSIIADSPPMTLKSMKLSHHRKIMKPKQMVNVGALLTYYLHKPGEEVNNKIGRHRHQHHSRSLSASDMLKNVVDVTKETAKREFQEASTKTANVMQQLGVSPDPIIRPSCMDDCLRDRQLSFAFWHFLKLLYCSENLVFYLEVEEYKQSEESIIQYRAEQIFQKYFVSGSEYELAYVGDELSESIKGELSNAHTSTFNTVQTIAWNILQLDLFPKFLHSDVFAAYTGKSDTNLALMRREEVYYLLTWYRKNTKKTARKNSDKIAVSIYSGVAFGVRRGACKTCNCVGYAPDSKDGVCSCSHWPSKHLNLGKQPTMVLHMIDDKDKIKQKLLEAGLKLVSALFDHTELENRESISKSMIKLFDFHDRSLALLKLALTKELRTTIDPAATLFREDKMSFRIVSNYIKIVGQDWLKRTLCPIITHVSNQKDISYEIGLHVKSSIRNKNIRNLNKLASLCTDAIFKAHITMPSKLRICLEFVRKEVKNMYPQFELKSVGVLMFLRLICPCLISPKAMGIMDENPPPDALRGLLAVAKILQNLSLGMRFDETKDAALTVMNDFLSKHEDLMRQFLNYITTPSDNNLLLLHGVSEYKVSREELAESVDTIYQEIKKSNTILKLEL